LTRKAVLNENLKKEKQESNYVYVCEITPPCHYSSSNVSGKKRWITFEYASWWRYVFEKTENLGCSTKVA
jgi:hypothetical protein